MYEELDDRMDDICGILIMVKAVYDATGYKIECTLDGDYFYDVYIEAMESATNELEYGTVMDYDNVNKYGFPQMDEYYELCKKYGRVNRISFKDNPYVKKASEIVATEMDGIYSYCLGWKLFTPKKKAKKMNDKYKLLGLFLFVAIPIPGTGAWTGSAIAAMMKMRLKHAILTIFAGVFVSGILMTLISAIVEWCARFF